MSTGDIYPTGPGGGPYAAGGDREVTFGDLARVLTAPADVMARVARQRKVVLGLAVVALLAGIGLISSLIGIATGAARNALDSPQLRQLPPETRQFAENIGAVSSPIGAVLGPFILWLLISGLVYLAARVFGGRGPFAAMLAVAGVALMPMVLSSLVGLLLSALGALVGANAGVAALLGLVNFVVSLIALVGVFALVIIGTRFAQGLTYGQSGGACALSCGGCVGLVLLLFIVLVALVGGLAAA